MNEIAEELCTRELEAALAAERDEHAATRRALVECQKEAFALRDGLRGWKQHAKKIEEQVADVAAKQDVIDAVHYVLEKLSPDSCGSLADRVRHAIESARK